MSHKHLSVLSGTSTRTVSRASVGRKLGVLQEEPRPFTATLVSANWLSALGPTNTDMVIGYRVQLLASAAAMNADQALRASTAGAASQANAPRRGRSQLSTLQVEPAAAKNRASDAKM